MSAAKTAAVEPVLHGPKFQNECRDIALHATYQIEALCRVMATMANCEDGVQQFGFLMASLAPRINTLNGVLMSYVGENAESPKELRSRLNDGLTPFTD